MKISWIVFLDGPTPPKRCFGRADWAYFDPASRQARCPQHRLPVQACFISFHILFEAFCPLSFAYTIGTKNELHRKLSNTVTTFSDFVWAIGNLSMEAIKKVPMHPMNYPAIHLNQQI